MNNKIIIIAAIIGFLANDLCFASKDGPQEGVDNAAPKVDEGPNVSEAAKKVSNAAGKGAQKVFHAAHQVAGAAHQVADAAGKGAQKVSEVADKVSNAAHKGAEKVSGWADGVSEQVDNFTNPPPHEPQQHNIISSTLYGIGRFARNATLETATLAGSLVQPIKKYAVTVPTAAYEHARESLVRIKSAFSGNPVNVNRGSDDQSTAQATEKEEANADSEASSSENAAAPDELKKRD